MGEARAVACTPRQAKGQGMQQAAISLDDVDVSLGRGAARVHILKGISLAIGAGEAVGLTGPSGSGKSTLLAVLAGLERAQRGTVTVEGTRIDRLDEDRLARFRGARIGIVFQSFHLIPTMTALENVAVPLELAGVPGAFDARGRGARPRRARRAARPLSGPAFGRRAAARRPGPRAGARSRHPGGRRADRQSRRGDRPRHHGPDLRGAPATRRHPGAGDARSGAGGALRPHHPAALGSHRARTGRGPARACPGGTMNAPGARLRGRNACRAPRWRCGSPGATCAAGSAATGSSCSASRSGSRPSSAVGSVSGGLRDGLAREGRTILGGDASFSTVSQPLDAAQRGYLAARGRLSDVVTTRGHGAARRGWRDPGRHQGRRRALSDHRRRGTGARHSRWRARSQSRTGPSASWPRTRSRRGWASSPATG